MEKKKPQNARDNRVLSYSLFVEQGMKQAKVCEILGVAAPQMSKWVKDGNWKELQEANHATPTSIKRSNYQLIADIQKLIKEEARTAKPSEADMVLKLSCANEKMDKKADLGHYTEVGEKFCSYLKNLPETEQWQDDAINAMLDFMSQIAKEFSYRS